jgi:hypothetical protein
MATVTDIVPNFIEGSGTLVRGCQFWVPGLTCFRFQPRIKGKAREIKRRLFSINARYSRLNRLTLQVMVTTFRSLKYQAWLQIPDSFFFWTLYFYFNQWYKISIMSFTVPGMANSSRSFLLEYPLKNDGNLLANTFLVWSLLLTNSCSILSYFDMSLFI